MDPKAMVTSNMWRLFVLNEILMTTNNFKQSKMLNIIYKEPLNMKDTLPLLL